MAAGAGTTDIVATPHADLEYKFQPAVIAQRIAALEAQLAGRRFVCIVGATSIWLSTTSRTRLRIPPNTLSITRTTY